MAFWWLGLILAVLLVAILCLQCVALAKQSGQSGPRRGRRGIPGPTGSSPTGFASLVGSTSQVAYAVGMSVAASIGNNLAIASAFGGENAFDFILMPIDPQNPTDTTRVLNSYAWSPVKDGTLYDLQVVFPPGDITDTGMTMFAQVWQRPACNATWTGTPMLASHQFLGDGGAFCMSDNSHSVPFGAGDRFTLVYYVDTGAWTPTASQIPDGISAGLGYAFGPHPI